MFYSFCFVLCSHLLTMYHRDIAVLFTQRVSALFKVTPNVGGEGNGTPLQYSCLENSIDGGAW